MTPLEASIAHWKKNAEAETPDDVRLGRENCALCQAHPDCVDCPVAQSIGMSGCFGTPYEETLTAWSLWNIEHQLAEWPNPIYQANFRNAANKEVRFLSSLLEVKDRKQ